MQSQLSDNNAIIIDKNIDSKIDNYITYNYKKRREELNTIVKNHIERQKQRTTQQNKSIAI